MAAKKKNLLKYISEQKRKEEKLCPSKLEKNTNQNISRASNNSLVKSVPSNEDPDTRITLWHKRQHRRLAGMAAPKRRNLESYLKDNSQWELYTGQDQNYSHKSHNNHTHGASPSTYSTSPKKRKAGTTACGPTNGGRNKKRIKKEKINEDYDAPFAPPGGHNCENHNHEPMGFEQEESNSVNKKSNFPDRLRSNIGKTQMNDLNSGNQTQPTSVVAPVGNFFFCSDSENKKDGLVEFTSGVIAEGMLIETLLASMERRMSLLEERVNQGFKKVEMRQEELAGKLMNMITPGSYEVGQPCNVDWDTKDEIQDEEEEDAEDYKNEEIIEMDEEDEDADVDEDDEDDVDIDEIQEEEAERRVTLWHKIEHRRLAGMAAPKKRNLEGYLKDRSEWEIYTGQDRFLSLVSHDDRVGMTDRRKSSWTEGRESGDHFKFIWKWKWKLIPQDVLNKICLFLGHPRDVISLGITCKGLWKGVGLNQIIWKDLWVGWWGNPGLENGEHTTDKMKEKFSERWLFEKSRKN